MNNLSSNIVLKKYGRSLVVVMQALAIALFLIMAAEYLLTEYWLITPHITARQKTWALLIVFGFIFSVQQVKKKRQTGLLTGLIIWSTVLVMALVGNYFYGQYYQQLQRYPKIFTVSSDWSIQGMKVRIEGKNFGPANEAGQVMVDDLQMNNVKWTEQSVLVEQPVPAQYFVGQLVLERADGMTAEGGEFEIKDPGKINQ